MERQLQYETLSRLSSALLGEIWRRLVTRQIYSRFPAAMNLHTAGCPLLIQLL